MPEGEDRGKGPEKIFGGIITQNFPNMGRESLTQIQEAQRIPYHEGHPNTHINQTD